MAIDTVGRKATTYFIGTEVERTAMYGERTLFVVGVQPVDKIVSIIKEQNSTQILVNTSGTFIWAQVKVLLLKTTMTGRPGIR